MSFCHVIKIKHIGQDIEEIIGGNQKWQGTRLSLVIILNKKKKKINRLLERKGINNESILVISIIDLKIWTKKYLIVPSREMELEELIIKGIILKRDISIPTQKNSQ